MEEIQLILNNWKKDRLDKIEIGSLYSRNKIVHKWKSPFRYLVIRELVFWRLIDLLEDIVSLLKDSKVLGARLLLRGAFETLGIIIYINQKVHSLINSDIDFRHFNEITTRLVLGTKSNFSTVESVNVLTVLEKCDKRYPGILDIYEDLSESSHPNFEGMSLGYSEIDQQEYITYFKNRWPELYMKDMKHLIMTCIHTFEYEYNNEFPTLFDSLEKWIEQHDTKLNEEIENTMR